MILGGEQLRKSLRCISYWFFFRVTDFRSSMAQDLTGSLYRPLSPPNQQPFGPPLQHPNQQPFSTGQQQPGQPGVFIVQPVLQNRQAGRANDYFCYSIFTMLFCRLPVGMVVLVGSIVVSLSLSYFVYILVMHQSV